MSAVSQEAPGKLETVRELLNTWLIPNDTRTPTDRLPVGAGAAMRALRDDLRSVVAREAEADEVLSEWIARLQVTPVVIGGAVRFRGRPGAGDLLAIVLEAVARGEWSRLKACPDCQWVFYDHTRNASKRWCLMNAGGPQGRSCGSIAKVQRHRSRKLAS
jgi:predicted RNA-binding Zn ribbon-like protein